MALLFNDKDVYRLLSMDDAIEAVDDAFRLWSNGEASLVPRINTVAPETPGHYYLRWFMPGTIYGRGVIGAKILLVVTPGTKPRKEATYAVLLFDAEDASLLAVIEGSALSKIRTGAVTGVAAKYLARESSSTMGIFGTADYAPDQVLAVCAVRPIQKIKIYSRNSENRLRFANDIKALVGCEVVTMENSEDTVVGSDIVVTVTDSSMPVFDGDLLEPGTFISAAGSSKPDCRETDDRTLLRSKIVVEYIDQAMKEAGDLVIPIADGVITKENIYAQIDEIVAGKKRGRVSEEEIFLFKYNGIAIEDIACALKIYENGRARGESSSFS